MDDVRLIDANALVKTIESIHCKDCNNYNGAMCRACTWMDAMDYIEDAQTIDAHPVKRGHWINHFDDLFPAESTIECSVCHEHSPADMPHDNFCPNCGAKMDGERKE